MIEGRPPLELHTGRIRSLGATAFEPCGVASGVFDAYLDCDDDVHGPWDYLGGMLMRLESGVSVADACGRDLVVCDPAARRTPIAAATPSLLDRLLVLRGARPGSA